MNHAFANHGIPRTVNVDGLTCLAFNEQAPGTPVVLIHGLLCSIYFWYPKHLSVFGDRPVYSIALPGHYPAPALKSGEQITPGRLVEAVFSQIEALIGQRRCVLVGHSTGAHAALLAAAARPEKVEGVVSIGGSLSGKEEGGIYAAFQRLAKFGLPGRSLIALGLKVNAVSLGVHKIFMRDVVAEPDRFFEDTDANHYVSYYFPALKAISGLSMASYFRDLASLDLRPYMPKVTAPVLVMSGNQDPYVPIPNTEALHAALTNSKMTLIDRSGHLPMFENWPLYHAAMTSFMDRVSSKADVEETAR
ncbi:MULTISPECIES: alpha/beta fold hydrolase [Marinobacter]|jgi:pimeloyl-ACP methyl ester carboxylesterase|uniref:Alpha/beta hydrolase n=1 Tax=Marinobacter sp. MMG032 TaxID=3158548 RepID=A0AAU7MVS2_9GAMM|nr:MULTISPECIES: alpha/beta hydrolase [Marinobacter]MBY5938979.1 alpha/beta hydrolase [Marinobacter nauticus]MBY5956273.1 alpha/beta hydrolase [Marinobacter nauticus]MBY6010064.1 alpha/beta hydrolase [Marinobacter nauticus]ROQ48634.1 pimeloyl-ACP methyl ester carboxylesterase [Marinobacter sp. 3-2]|tara:strand:- start:32838 stop:33752 length:915 start_codon:yes stop_codon:yes gene_type:complete